VGPRRALAGALVVLGLFISGGSGCREDSPAFKKADLGRALAERGDNDAAVAKLKDALADDPKLVMAHETLAQTYEAMGRYPEAIGEYRATVALDPVRDTAFARMGCLILATDGATDEAEAALEKAVSINRTHAGAHACLAAVHLDRQDFPKAIAEGERAVALDPQSVQGHLTLGIALAETGSRDRARTEIQQAIALSGEDSAVAEQARTYLQSLDHPDVPGGPDAPGGDGELH
jgi:tetratricopeptide (TPR) repeat protein